MEAPAWPSVDDVKPLEEGGPVARKGFNYQDEIAVSVLLDMMEDPSIVKIHCETHDDILVVRATEAPAQYCAEYVQVKATQPDQLWTVAALCKRNDGKVGTSVLEKSLAHDKHEEASRFRILTLRQVSAELQVLTNPVGSLGREPGCLALTTLKAEIDKKHPELVSPKGNDCAFWLANCHWDERHDEDAVRTENRLRVFQISSAQSNTLLPEAIDALLDDMRAWVKDAGAASWVPDRDKKIIARDQLLTWWDVRVAELTSAGGASGGKLVRKMKAASLPQDVINLAVNLRRTYAKSLRTPRYADADDADDLLSRVSAEALSLRSRYVTGQLAVDGATFHSMCLDRMDAINAERPAGVPDRSPFLKGCLYDIADRCLLRFERMASPLSERLERAPLIHDYWLFVATGVLLNLTPGQDTFYILGRGVAEGTRSGVASALGIAVGSLLHTAFAALGLSAVLATSASAFAVVKLLGAAYLIYLGMRMLWAANASEPAATRAGAGAFGSFRDGIVTNVLNPKVALFFLALIPQFIEPDSATKVVAFIVLGLTFVTTGTMWCLILAVAAGKLSGFFALHPKRWRFMSRASGGIFVLLGLRLAVSRQ